MFQTKVRPTADRPAQTSHSVVDLLAPFVAELFNRSLAVGLFPAAFKDYNEAFTTAVMKKQGLGPADVSSYNNYLYSPIVTAQKHIMTLNNKIN